MNANTRISFAWFSLAIVLAVIHSAKVSAELQILTTAESPFNTGLWNQGWWSDSFGQSLSGDTSDTYLTGYNINHAFYNGFFTFDLAFVNENVDSALIKIRDFGSFSPDPLEPLGFFDVSTPAHILNSKPGHVDLNILNDLGTGNLYALVDAPIVSSPTPKLLEVQLNETAISDINDNLGGYFSVGLSLIDVDPHEGMQWFGGRGQDPPGGMPVELVLRLIPEPNTQFLFAVSLMLLSGFATVRRSVACR